MTLYLVRKLKRYEYPYSSSQSSKEKRGERKNACAP
jgi:hypothetical protein